MRFRHFALVAKRATALSARGPRVLGMGSGEVCPRVWLLERRSRNRSGRSSRSIRLERSPMRGVVLGAARRSSVENPLAPLSVLVGEGLRRGRIL